MHQVHAVLDLDRLKLIEGVEQACTRIRLQILFVSIDEGRSTTSILIQMRPPNWTPPQLEVFLVHHHFPTLLLRVRNDTLVVLYLLCWFLLFTAPK